jgi:hypothetical protein
MIYKWPTRQDAEAAVVTMKAYRPEFVYGPVVLLSGGFAVIVTKDEKCGFVGKAEFPSPGGAKPAKRSRAWEFGLWVLLLALLGGAAGEYFRLFR